MKMTIQELHQQYMDDKEKLIDMYYDLEEMKRNAYGMSGIDYSKDRVMSSGSGHASYEAMVDKCFDLQKKIDAQNEKTENDYNCMLGEINGIEDDRDRYIFQCIYLYGMNYAQTAREAKVSTKTVQRTLRKR